MSKASEAKTASDARIADLDLKAPGGFIIKDQLSHDERLRLECVAQAVATGAIWRPQDVADIVNRAGVIEAYVRHGEAAGEA